MERQETPCDNLPLESSLTDLILNPKSEKIRRPPNAFMLFARDHRRIISKQHPDVSNKVISSMLGKIWKNTVRDIKEKYYRKAKILGELHKTRYPDYVYSPREARIQKMNKKKKKDEANLTDAVTQSEDVAETMELTKREDNSNKEEWITDTNNDPKSSPEYIPNNPEYFAQQSPEILPEEDPALDFRPRSGYSIESQYHQELGDLPMKMEQGWTEKNCVRSTTSERCDCCNQNRLGYEERCVHPYEKRESEGVIPHYPDHLPCSFAATSRFCSPPPHFTGPMSSYCCGPRPCTSPIQRPYGPPLHPYWNSPMMNSPCYPGREYFYEDLKAYPFSTHFHTPDFYGQFGYFDRPVAQLKRNLDSGYHPHLREGLDFSRRGQNRFGADNSVPYPYFRRSDESEENIHRSFDGCSRAENEMTPQNRRILRSDVKNKEQVNHQNPATRTEIKTQDASSSHMCISESEGGRHLSEHLYQNIWDSHSLGDRSVEMASIDPISTEHYQCHSRRRSGNKNSPDLAGIYNDNSQTQSEDVSNSAISPESHKRKLNALYAEENDCVTSTNPKLYRLSILPTSEATRPNFWSSTVAKSPLTKNKIQESHKQTTMLDQPIYSNLDNNISVTSGKQYSSNTNKILNDSFTAAQNKNRPENIMEDKEGVPLNFGFSKVPTQMAEECPTEFDSAYIQDNQIQRKNHDIPINVQNSQFYRPLVKMEFSSKNNNSINELNERNLDIRDGENNQQNNTFRAVMKMKHEVFPSATAKQEKFNSIKGDQTNIENNSFVTSNNTAENTNVGPQNLASIISYANQTNMTGNFKHNLSKTYFKSANRPVGSHDNTPEFSLINAQKHYETSSNSSATADPNPTSSNLSPLQTYIKMEDNENDHFYNH